MIIRKLALRASKVSIFFALSLIVGRTLGSPELWFDHELATRIAKFIYGDGEIGADNFYDLYFYISFLSVFSVTTVNYILTMKLIQKIRRN